MNTELILLANNFAHELTDQDKIFLLIGLIFLALGLIALLVLSLIFKGKKGDIGNGMNPSDNNVRIYRYNYANKTFYCFDRFNPTNTKEFTEQEFLSQFLPSDKYRVQDWLREIAHQETFPKYIQAEIKINTNGKMVPTMLEFTSINNKGSLIHFESHLFPALFSGNVSPKASEKRMKRFTLDNEKEAGEFLQHEDAESLGAVFYFSAYQKLGEGKPIPRDRLEKINDQIRPVIGRFLNKTRKMLKVNRTDEVLIDTSVVSRAMAYSIASIIATSIQQFLNYSLPDDDVSFAIGFTVGSFYKQDFIKGKYQASSMVKAIKEGYSEDRIMFYDPEFYEKYADKKRHAEEIHMVVENSTFRIYYTPTLSLTRKAKDFYFTDIVPFGTSIQDFQEVLKMAHEEKGATQALLNGIIEMCEKRVGAQKNVKMVLYLPYSEVSTFVSLTSGRKKIHWIIAIREADLMTYAEEQKNVNDEFDDIKEKGYEIALVIDNPSSELRTKTLSRFSYFFVPPSFTSENLDFTRSHNNLRIIENNYLPYQVPLVFYGLKDFDDIELAAHYSGTIFQCDQLSLPSSALEEIEPEKIEMVDKLTKNLLPHHESTVAFSLAPMQVSE